MTDVLIDGGRTVDTADYIDNGEVGTLAAGIAGTVFDLAVEATAGVELPPAQQFSLKVNGTVLSPDASTPTFADADIVELVEITDYVWPEDVVVNIAIDETTGGAIVVADPDAVPDGTIDEILEWIGARRDRAQAARDAEAARDHPRTTLIEQLDGMIDDDDGNN